jgi:cell division transport system ATP-binding protein
MIEFQNVAVCYNPGARHPASALENISLKIDRGEWVFLVGPSGAGKSTLLKLLHCSVFGGARITGRVALDGRDITHLSAREIPFVRRKIGVVHQDFQLLAQKTAWENVAFALRVIGTPQSRIAREVPRALDIVGLAHRAHAQPHELSGGEQQRIAIARAIVNDPPLLLADEPTGNLDPDTAAGIAEVLQRINQERSTTVVMATHDRHLVDSMRRRVVRVRDGKIASDEAQGVYHPEDDEPGTGDGKQSADGSTQATENAAPDAAREPSTQPADERPVEEEKPRVRLKEPQDAITRDALGNAAPLGSDENPIVQYGKR